MIDPPVKSHSPILETPKRSTTPAEDLASWFMAQSEHSPSQALLHACCTALAYQEEIWRLEQQISRGMMRLPPTFETRAPKPQPKVVE